MKLRKIIKNDFSELKEMINTARWQEKVFLASKKRLSVTDVSSFINEKKQKGNYWNYIIWEKNKIAGYIDFEILSNKQGHIAGIYVKPEFRRRGLAKEALEFAMNQLKKKDVKSICANIFIDNEPVRLLFKSQGFVESEQFEHADKRLALKLTLEL